MNAQKKAVKRKYKKVIELMTDDEKIVYDYFLSLQSSYKVIEQCLHQKLFSEEYDFMYDNVDAKRRRKNENPMSEEYIKKMNDKRIKLDFLPLSKNGYAQDSDKTKEYIKKLLTGEIEYKVYSQKI